MDDNQKKVGLAYVEMRRETVRAALNPIYLPYFDNLCEALANTFWAPYSGGRDLVQQTKLYAMGRTTPGPIVTNANSGDSAHNWGCATDWAEMNPTYTGQEMWNKANWNQFSDAVRGVGMVWGGDFQHFPDKPHAELRLNGVSWKAVGDVYRAKGQQAALDFIAAHSKQLGGQNA